MFDKRAVIQLALRSMRCHANLYNAYSAKKYTTRCNDYCQEGFRIALNVHKGHFRNRRECRGVATPGYHNNVIC